MNDREKPRTEAAPMRHEAGPAPPRPPGEFLTEDLASATARFLEQVKERIDRSAEGGGDSARRRP